MGFGTSATQMVFFIAAIVIAVGVIGSFNTSVSKLSGNVQARSEALSNELTTDIRIVNDAGDMPNTPLVIYILNTGTRTLDPTGTVILLDGQAHTDLAFDVLENAEDTTWRQGEVLQITLTGSALASGDHRVKAIAGQGIADTIRFNIP